jgi:hypothetical protein
VPPISRARIRVHARRPTNHARPMARALIHVNIRACMVVVRMSAVSHGQTCGLKLQLIGERALSYPAHAKGLYMVWSVRFVASAGASPPLSAVIGREEPPRNACFVTIHLLQAESEIRRLGYRPGLNSTFGIVAPWERRAQEQPRKW